MKAATIRKLKHDTSTVLAWVEGGESVEVRRRAKTVAMLTPVSRSSKVSRPDFASRLEAQFGKKRLAATATELLADERGDT